MNTVQISGPSLVLINQGVKFHVRPDNTFEITTSLFTDKNTYFSILFYYYTNWIMILCSDVTQTKSRAEFVLRFDRARKNCPARNRIIRLPDIRGNHIHIMKSG